MQLLSHGPNACVLIVFLLQQIRSALGQYPPPIVPNSNLTVIHSPIDNGITITFKSPPVGTCTTVFPSQKQYTGYVNLPPFTLAPVQQNYSVNTFFWFIEARENASMAPLTIYLNGGPGSSSMVGLFLESGPCEVVEIAQGQLGTQARDWGWDRSSNMLFVDQPDQVGFSYDILTNGTLDLLNSSIFIPPAALPQNLSANYLLNGTFSSNSYLKTSNTTEIAAQAVWHMLQGFLAVFPQYNPGTQPNSTAPGVVGINLFTESYGGKFGPAFASHFEQQNQMRRNGSISIKDTLEIQLVSLGILQGCIDDLVQGRYYPLFANNNSYGITALSLVDELNAANSFLSADGCQQQIQSCRDSAAAMDPQDHGDVARVNQMCQQAEQTCNNNVIGPYEASGRDVYDIAQMNPDPFPPSTYLEYLNSAAVQSAIGTMVNYTESNNAVSTAFLSTGDYDRGNQIAQMSYLLSLGVRVALIYGDRDYICNWYGGEAVSFSIAAQSPQYAPFYSAGYAQIVVNSSYVGGVVRQYGNLSFSRIYDAGHLVPAYQPETAFTVFTRIIMGTDISTGEPVDLSSFTTAGDANATHTNKPPAQFAPTCWIRNINKTCTNDQRNMFLKGDGVIINGVLYKDASEWPQPAPSVKVNAGMPGTLPLGQSVSMASSFGNNRSSKATGTAPTGVYVATSTPTMAQTGAAGSGRTMSIGFLMLGSTAALWISQLLF